MRIVLENDTTIDAILLAGGSTVVATVNVLQQLNKTNDVMIGMFDFAPEAGDLIINGNMKFAISQQPYLQGYLPVALATIQIATGNGKKKKINKYYL